MNQTETRFDRSAIGRYAAPETVPIASEQIAAYAAAVGAGERGPGAPALFVVVPAWRAAWSAMAGFDTAIEGDGSLGLHEAQEMALFRPLRAGDVVTTRSAVCGMRMSSLGTKVLVRTVTCDATGEPLAIQHSTTFFPGETGRGEVGTMLTARPGRAAARDGEPVRASCEISRARIAAYAAASNDRTPIHTDPNAARARGLADVVAHGMCLSALVCEQSFEALGIARTRAISHLGVRFSAPATPGTTMTTSFWRADADTVAFESAGGDGSPLMRRGTIEFAAERGTERS